jgi:hypothetical protein
MHVIRNPVGRPKLPDDTRRSREIRLHLSEPELVRLHEYMGTHGIPTRSDLLRERLADVLAEPRQEERENANDHRASAGSRGRGR